MLKIFLDKHAIQDKDVVTDVEREFSTFELPETDINKTLIQRIEQGQYNDAISSIDRFGFKLYTEDMSTGCKAALCVVNKPEKIIDLRECGNNARDAIIATCNEGCIFFEYNGITISTIYGKDIEVFLDGYVFTNIDRLNQYGVVS